VDPHLEPVEQRLGAALVDGIHADVGVGILGTVHRDLRICERQDASPFLLHRGQFHQTVTGPASAAPSTGVFSWLL
jgi:hypothetical protein